MTQTLNPHREREAAFHGAAIDEAGVAVVLLHGRRQSPADARALFDALDAPRALCVLPSARERSWYPHGFMAPLAANQPSLDYAIDCVDAAVRVLLGRGFDASRIVFMGFSQGACLAAHYVYTHPAAWGGLVALSGGLIGPPGQLPRPPARALTMPVLLGASDADSWIPLPRVQETAALFRAAGATVDLRVYPGMPHQTNDDETQAARALLAALAERSAALA
ncbi:phospholipase/carboxylesterase [Janthinobacterium sp. CG_23.3]|uniref:alpha/beta hydrolase n=1 Tax=Janthinobacterium sp. CG_23.3 TaxID=3349634 RepID=UPI0038D43993